MTPLSSAIRPIGRLILGLGAGWNDREYYLFGFDLREPDARFERFNEGMDLDDLESLEALAKGVL